MITYVTYAQLAIDTRLLVKKIPVETLRRVAGVLGVPRSGMLPATMIANQLHVPLGDTDSFVRCQAFAIPGRRLFETGFGGGDVVLIVDDSAYAGITIEQWKKQLELLSSRYAFMSAVVYRNPDKESRPDYYAKDILPPRYFEWNLLQHPDSTGFMLDLDGVLCYDPEPFDDDGIKYRDSLVNAMPLHLPKRMVHSICTMRIERWRGITEDWLFSNGVNYGSLYMSPYTKAEDRRVAGGYGKFKGSLYKKHSATLFVESTRRQAVEIAEYSGKPVICLTTGEVFQ